MVDRMVYRFLAMDIWITPEKFIKAAENLVAGL
jgi:hypothetical protein